ncbi:MAG: LexA family transcriptional regulator [Moraxellaceae bacterium]
MNSIGSEIRKRRKGLGLTIEQLALQVDSDVGNISRLERGIQGVSEPLAKRIAAVLGCNLAELYGAAEDLPAAVPIGAKRIPLYSALEFSKADNFTNAIAHKWLVTDIESSASCYAVDMDDPAMLSEIKIGDRVLIDPSIQPVPGDLFAVHSYRTKQSYIRKYRALGFNAGGDLIFEARPIDADYPVLQAESDLLQVLGVVIEHRRIRKRT